MVPTRELALQIDQQLDAFAYFLPVTSVDVYGGGDGAIFSQQERAMRQGVDVVIATPGRLISLLNMGKIDMSYVQFFVLDEADRMLEMGFVDDIMRIASYLPKQKQTLLFSATMAPKIRELARKTLINPTEIQLATSKPADKIDQSAYVCYEAQKLALIQGIFTAQSLTRVIVFSPSKQKVKEIYPNGIHEAIVSVEDWELAQQKRKKLGVKREKIYNLDHEHLLSGLLRCPVCGAAMYGNINRKKKPDGTTTTTQYDDKQRITYTVERTTSTVPSSSASVTVILPSDFACL